MVVARRRWEAALLTLLRVRTLCLLATVGLFGAGPANALDAGDAMPGMDHAEMPHAH